MVSIATIAILFFAAILLVDGCSPPPLKLRQPRSFANAFTVNNNVVVAGGWTRSGDPSNVMEIFNLARNQTSTVIMKLARARFATAYLNDRILIAGGCLDVFCSNVTSLVEIYDSNLNYLGESHLSEARGCLTSIVESTKAVFLGGCTGITQSSDAVDVYDTSTGSWTSFHLPLTRSDGSTAVLDGLIMYAGGWSNISVPVARVDISELPFHQWRVANLTEERYALAAATTGNHLMFAGGGNLVAELSIVDVFNAANSTWSTTQLSEAKSWMSAATLGSQAFFGGGWMSASRKSDLIEIYDEISMQWTTKRLSQGRYGIASASANHKVLFAGGQTDGGWNDFQFISEIVDVYSPPAIVAQQADIDCYFPNINGANVWVRAIGQGLSYQWLKNGHPVGNATTDASLQLQNIDINDNGTIYQVIVTDQCGDSVISRPSRLNLHLQPTLHVPGVYQHQSLNISVEGYATTYTWFMNSQQLNNSGSFIVFDDIDIAKNGSMINVKATLDGDFIWLASPITVWGPPEIDATSMPKYIKVIEQRPYNFTVEATGYNLTFIWFVDDVAQPLSIGQRAHQLFYFAGVEHTSHSVCVQAANQAGVDKSCTSIDVVPYSSVFLGPTSSKGTTWIIEQSNVALSIEIADVNCRYHYWTYNKHEINNTRTTEKTSTFYIQQLNNETDGKYSVEAFCYDRMAEADPISFTIIRLYALALLIIGGVAGLVAIAALSVRLIKAQRRITQEHILQELKAQMDQTIGDYNGLPQLPNNFNQIHQNQLPFVIPGNGLDFFRNGVHINPTDGFAFPTPPILPVAESVEANITAIFNMANVNVPSFWTKLGGYIRKLKMMLSREHGHGGELQNLVEHPNHQVSTTVMVYPEKSPLFILEAEPGVFKLGEEPTVINLSLTLAARKLQVVPISIVFVCAESAQNGHYFVYRFNVRTAKSKWIDLADVVVDELAGPNHGFYNGKRVFVKHFGNGNPELYDNEVLTHRRMIDASKYLVKFVGATLRDTNVPRPLFIATAYAEGGNLLEWIRRHHTINTLPQIRKIVIARNILSAIATLHSSVIAHCDIKLENILISDDKALLTDFGSAVHGDRYGAILHAGNTTAGYFTEGELADVMYDVRCFGCVLWCLCTDSLHPPTRDDIDRLGDDPREELIRQCLHIDRARRPTLQCIERKLQEFENL